MIARRWLLGARAAVFAVGAVSAVSAVGADAVLGLGVAAGCSSAAETCTPGQQIVCGCPDGTKSAQVCSEDGSGYGKCLACPVNSTGTKSSGDSACVTYCKACLGVGNCAEGCANEEGCAA